MSTFFHGWRRKLGCVILAVACLLTVGWVRSMIVRDFVDLGRVFKLPMNRGLLSGIENDRGHIAFMRTDLRPEKLRVKQTPFEVRGNLRMNPAQAAEEGSEELAVLVDTEVTVMRVVTSPIFTVPYWSIVIPLTLISAWLLLRRSESSRTEPGMTRL